MAVTGKVPALVGPGAPPFFHRRDGNDDDYDAHDGDDVYLTEQSGGTMGTRGRGGDSERSWRRKGRSAITSTPLLACTFWFRGTHSS